MPVLKVICSQDAAMIKRTGSRRYQDDMAIEEVVNYVLSPQKTCQSLVGGIAVSPGQAAFEMRRLSQAYGKFEGLRLRHMVLSFSKDEIRRFGKRAYDILMRIAFYAAQFYGHDYQIVYAVHTDAENLHIHFVMNSVSYRTGRKYPGTKADYHEFCSYLGDFLMEYFSMPLTPVSDVG